MTAPAAKPRAWARKVLPTPAGPTRGCSREKTARVMVADQWSSLRQPVGTGPGGQGPVSAGGWTSDKDRCATAGVPEDRRGYLSKTELALEKLGRALARGHLKTGWVAADDAFGMSPSFREALAALGMRYILDVPAGFTVWPVEPEWTTAVYRGRGGPPSPGRWPDIGAPSGSAATRCRGMPGGRSR